MVEKMRLEPPTSDEWLSYMASIEQSLEHHALKERYKEDTSMLDEEKTLMASLRPYGTTYEVVISFKNFNEFCQELDRVAYEYGPVYIERFFEAAEPIEDPTVE